MEVYLDNAATTKPFDSVRTAMAHVMEHDYANPSSLHKMGWVAEQCIFKARETIAGSLKCEPSDILFTSGGTEANNLALIGTATAKRREGNHIVTTRIEHASVWEPLRYLSRNGFDVTYVNVDANGRVNKEELVDAIRDDTVLISIIAVNNEMGAVQDVGTLSSLAKQKNRDVTVHVDAIQAYGKLKILPKRLGVDLFTASAHKIHGPKGVGFLYKDKKVKLNPILFGGGQEMDMRSGTENVPGIVGMGKAVEEMGHRFDLGTERMYALKSKLIKGLNQIPEARVNGMEGIPVKDTAPHIVSVSFDGIRSEVLLHALEERGIYVSSGSACASNHPTISPTLQAIGIREERLHATLRFSHSLFTQEEEMDYTLKALKELVPILSKYKRK